MRASGVRPRSSITCRPPPSTTVAGANAVSSGSCLSVRGSVRVPDLASIMPQADPPPCGQRFEAIAAALETRVPHACGCGPDARRRGRLSGRYARASSAAARHAVRSAAESEKPNALANLPFSNTTSRSSHATSGPPTRRPKRRDAAMPRSKRDSVAALTPILSAKSTSVIPRWRRSAPRPRPGAVTAFVGRSRDCAAQRRASAKTLTPSTSQSLSSVGQSGRGRHARSWPRSSVLCRRRGRSRGEWTPALPARRGDARRVPREDRDAGKAVGRRAPRVFPSPHGRAVGSHDNGWSAFALDLVRPSHKGSMGRAVTTRKRRAEGQATAVAQSRPASPKTSVARQADGPSPPSTELLDFVKALARDLARADAAASAGGPPAQREARTSMSSSVAPCTHGNRQ